MHLKRWHQLSWKDCQTKRTILPLCHRHLNLLSLLKPHLHSSNPYRKLKLGFQPHSKASRSKHQLQQQQGWACHRQRINHQKVRFSILLSLKLFLQQLQCRLPNLLISSQVWTLQLSNLLNQWGYHRCLDKIRALMLMLWRHSHSKHKCLSIHQCKGNNQFSSNLSRTSHLRTPIRQISIQPKILVVEAIIRVATINSSIGTIIIAGTSTSKTCHHHSVLMVSNKIWCHNQLSRFKARALSLLSKLGNHSNLLKTLCHSIRTRIKQLKCLCLIKLLHSQLTTTMQIKLQNKLLATHLPISRNPAPLSSQLTKANEMRVTLSRWIDKKHCRTVKRSSLRDLQSHLAISKYMVKTHNNFMKKTEEMSERDELPPMSCR